MTPCKLLALCVIVIHGIGVFVRVTDIAANSYPRFERLRKRHDVASLVLSLTMVVVAVVAWQLDFSL